MSRSNNAFHSPSSQRRKLLKTGLAGSLGVLGASTGFNLLAQDIRLADQSRVVRTQNGRITGSRYSNGVDAFYGIPYAAPAQGAARFMAPSAPESWSGVKSMNTIGNRCPQALGGPLPEVFALDRAEPMGEDCQVINVYTPSSNGRGQLPVMVWLHGGGYSSGSGGWILYDGSMLAQSQDVVVVTVNHRLNVFGHLHLEGLGGEQYADSGNAGMLDIVAVLKWVNNNIEAFGGNPDNVTLFGQSGGAGKVSTLLAMPEADGLFHKAIAMSGAAVTGISAEQATDTSEQYLSTLGISTNQLSQLHDIPMTSLLDAFLATPGMNLGPVIDGKNLPEHPFSPTAPAQSAHIPMILGSTEHEVNFIPGYPLAPIDDDNFLQRVTQDLGGSQQAAQEIIDTYREGRPDTSNVELYQIFASDNTFRRGVFTEAELKSEQEAPVYMYYFDWKSPVRNGILGAYHCVDIPFAFNNVDECAAMVGAGQERYPLASNLSTAFGQFAHTGDPNHSGLPQWQTFDQTERATMMMNNSPSLVKDPYSAERAALYNL